jgi:hypothetical protein
MARQFGPQRYVNHFSIVASGCNRGVAEIISLDSFWFRVKVTEVM